MAEAAVETKPKRWYIVHAYSNFENKVADSIREQAKQRSLTHLFDEVLVPKEKVVEVRRGRKVDAERKFFQEVRQETNKVTWPSRKETGITTAMVFIFAALAASFFLLADQLIRFAVTLVLGIGS